MLIFAASLNAHQANAQTTYFPATGVYNGYLQQTNIVECDNSGDKPVHPELRLLASNGTLLAKLALNISARGSQHIILNDLSNIVDSYGTYRIVLPTSESLLGDKLSCRTAFYRPSSSGADKPYDFAYVLPVRNPDSGVQAGAFNSYSPDGSNNPTFNWLSIVNFGTKPFSAEIELYDSAGRYVESRFVDVLAPTARTDLALGHDVGQVVGTYRIVPVDPSQKYQAFLMRYGVSGAAFKFAFPLISNAGSCSGTVIPLSTMGSANTANWLEVVNLNEITIPVTIIIRDRFGIQLQRRDERLAPFAQYHLFANPIIDPSNSGNVGSAQILCRDSSDRILSESLYYGRSSTSQLEWAYASQDTGSTGVVPGTQLVTPVNTYLGMANWLKLANAAADSVVKYQVFDDNGEQVAAGEQSVKSRGTADIGIHAQMPQDRIGLVTSTSPTSGSKFSGELLRILSTRNGGVGTIIQIPGIIQRRGIGGQHGSSGETATGFIGDPQSLSQYRDQLTYEEASHLFTHATLGASYLEIKAAQLAGLQATVNQMFTIDPTPSLDAEAYRWVDDSYDTNTGTVRYRGVQKFWIHHLLNTPNPLKERVALIWNDVLATSCRVVGDIRISNACYHHLALLRRHSLGNYRTLVTDISTDFTMLRWLNGYVNRKGTPDENYAREFWELFALGETSKHTGRYRLYDSRDVAEAARAFTGWTAPTPEVQSPTLKSVFVASRFDSGEKTIFHSTPYQAKGNFNHRDLVNKTLARPETAQWVVKRLFSALVHDHPNAAVVNELADLLIANNYETAPVIRKIILSEAMFSTDARKSRVKDAVTYGVGFIRSTRIPASTLSVFNRLANDGMGYEPLNPPSVNGWPLNKYNGAKLSEYFLGWTTSYPNFVRSMLKGAEGTGSTYSFSSLIPFTGATVEQIVDHWSLVLGVQLSSTERTQIINYMNTQRQTDGTDKRVLFDATNSTHVRQKLPGLLWILAQHEDYFTF